MSILIKCIVLKVKVEKEAEDSKFYRYGWLLIGEGLQFQDIHINYDPTIMFQKI